LDGDNYELSVIYPPKEDGLKRQIQLVSICLNRYYNNTVHELPTPDKYKYQFVFHNFDTLQTLVRHSCVAARYINLQVVPEHRQLTLRSFGVGIGKLTWVLKYPTETEVRNKVKSLITLAPSTTVPTAGVCGYYLLRSLRMALKYFRQVHSVTFYCSPGRPLVVSINHNGRSIAICHLFCNSDESEISRLFK
jgi:hypothetical protein